MADIIATVSVDTQNITAENLNTTVVLRDTNNDADKTAHESSTFVIYASAGQTVAFRIAALDGVTPVGLVAFAQTSGVAAFSTLPAAANSFVGTVSETVQGGEEFNITFTVNSDTYTLDPQLQAGQ